MVRYSSKFLFSCAKPDESWNWCHNKKNSESLKSCCWGSYHSKLAKGHFFGTHWSMLYNRSNIPLQSKHGREKLFRKATFKRDGLADERVASWLHCRAQGKESLRVDCHHPRTPWIPLPRWHLHLGHQFPQRIPFQTTHCDISHQNLPLQYQLQGQNLPRHLEGAVEPGLDDGQGAS